MPDPERGERGQNQADTCIFERCAELLEIHFPEKEIKKQNGNRRLEYRRNLTLHEFFQLPDSSTPPHQAAGMPGEPRNWIDRNLPKQHSHSIIGQSTIPAPKGRCSKAQGVSPG
jgi:hypothetical protein